MATSLQQVAAVAVVVAAAAAEAAVAAAAALPSFAEDQAQSYSAVLN